MPSAVFYKRCGGTPPHHPPHFFVPLVALKTHYTTQSNKMSSVSVKTKAKAVWLSHSIKVQFLEWPLEAVPADSCDSTQFYSRNKYVCNMCLCALLIPFYIFIVVRLHSGKTGGSHQFDSRLGVVSVRVLARPPPMLNQDPASTSAAVCWDPSISLHAVLCMTVYVTNKI